MNKFDADIKEFNRMYKLPVSEIPSIDLKLCTPGALAARLAGFKHTIKDEIEEVDDIIMSLQLGFRCHKGNIVEPRVPYDTVEFLTDMADWLGDIQVYCASEMAKFGLPLYETLAIIMSSNFSKMGAEGVPIYDEHGKVLKGPGYWKPEPRLKQMIEQKIEEAQAAVEASYPSGIVWR